MEHEKNNTRCLFKYILPAINNGFMYEPSKGEVMLKIKERKKIKKVIEKVCLVTTLIEKSPIASSEKILKNLKKYKSLEIEESSTSTKEENE